MQSAIQRLLLPINQLVKTRLSYQLVDYTHVAHSERNRRLVYRSRGVGKALYSEPPLVTKISAEVSIIFVLMGQTSHQITGSHSCS
jgi:hypothetical protein